MFLKILTALAVLVLMLVVIVAMQPSDFRVSRSTTVAAPPIVPFGLVNDLHNWQKWSPWAKLDPAAKLTFAGPDSGAEASYTWNGNDKVGEGTMTITESQPTSLIRFQLDFVRPFKATNSAEFTFKPEGEQTLVTWSMSGHNNFLFKAVGLFMNCDKMIGGEFEKGLAELKSISEAVVKK